MNREFNLVPASTPLRSILSVAVSALAMSMSVAAQAGSIDAVSPTVPLATSASDLALSPRCQSLVSDPATSSPPLNWIDAGRSHADLALLRATLLDAHSHGLDPADYAASGIDKEAARLLADARTSVAPHDHVAAFNRAATDAAACYLQHVHRGVVETASLYPTMDVPREPWSAGQALQQAWRTGSLAMLLTTAAPQTHEYRELRAALSTYRDKARNEGKYPSRMAAPGNGASSSEPDGRIDRLRDRLVFLGDMSHADRRNASLADHSESVAAPAGAPALDSLTRAALERFQARHGLPASGLVDAATRRELAVPMRARVAQIELAMERARWLPDLGDAPHITVNLPAFTLQAENTRADQADRVQLNSRVVIGRAGTSPTPVYLGQVERIEFNPYWYVPAPIAKREIVPKLLRNPAWLARQDMEIVSADGVAHQQATPALINAVAQGKASLRQRPGDRNALGQIKFVLPNSRNIYLHDTSARHLFALDRRDLSHGCVRVEQPAQLAEIVLAGNDSWNQARIARTMKEKRTVIARPGSPVKVVFTYQTVVVNDDGLISFLPDVYRHDDAANNAVARWAQTHRDLAQAAPSTAPSTLALLSATR